MLCMKLISVNKLIPGMVVSENIYTLDDKLVLPKGTILDEKDITRIKAHSLYNIFVEDIQVISVLTIQLFSDTILS